MGATLKRLAVLASGLGLVSGSFVGMARAATATPAVSGANVSTPANGNGNANAANPASPAYGHPYRHGVVPTVGQNSKMKAYASTHAGTAPANNSGTLSYDGGIDGIGVTSGQPKVYLVFWGSQWGTQSTNGNGDYTFSNDYDNGAPYIQEMFKGLGTNGELWSGVMTQYCDGPGLNAGVTSCPSAALHVGYPSSSVLAGVWYDGSATAPSAATGFQIGTEAVAAAAHFGNTTAASNRYVQYDILSAPFLDPDSYQESGFCAWHDYTGDSTLDGGGAVPSPYGDLAFTNMPYVMDLGATCGQNFVNPGNPGTLDGYSIVNGHEYAETITDQNPPGGWTNNNPSSTLSGDENADECAWISSGQGASANVTFSTGSFAMQSTWSNDTNRCDISHSIVVTSDFSVADNPGSGEIPAGSPTSTTVSTAITAGSAQSVSLTASGLPTGATASFSPTSVTAGNSAKLTISTSASTPTGTYTVNVTGVGLALSHSTTFSLTVDPPPATATKVLGDGQTASAATQYSNPLEVQLLDAGNNPVRNAAVTFRAPSSGASVTFSAPCSGNQCTVNTDSNGDATTPPVTANTIAGGLTVSVTVAGVGSPPAFGLTNLAGQPSKLAFLTQPPSSVQMNSGFNPVVGVQDAYGNVVTTDNSDVASLAISTNPGSGTLTCTDAGGTTVTVSSGTASFTCSINMAGGGYKLQATSGSLTPSTSNSFNVTAPTSISASASPSPASFGQSVTYSATVSSSSGNPAGNVTFKAGSTSLCTATLSGGTGSCVATNAPPGTDTVTASYGGDSSHSASSGNTSLLVHPPMDQIFGSDAIQTAISVSTSEFPTMGTASAVVLARSDFFSDALAGGPLAAYEHAPLLITPGAGISSTLDSRVQAEIQRVLAPGGTVYILGGTLALSHTIDSTLQGLGYNVVRVAGTTEYDTAVQIAQQMGNPSVVFEATGLSFYDALSAVPAAIKEHAAILLTEGSQQAPETAQYLSQHTGDTRYVIGGPLAAWGADPVPAANAIYGDTLYDTSAAVATKFFPGAQIFGAATSETFSDALAGSVFMATGTRSGPLLVVSPSLPVAPSIAAYLASLTSCSQGYVFGGPLAMPQDVVGALQSATG